MPRNWIDKRQRPDECFTDCEFCNNLIDKKRKGIMLTVAQFYCWDCLLKLRNEINILKGKLQEGTK